MGLFDKKYCDVCGAKIGLLGNRKLEDGNLCKECAKKLSPWFSDRRRSTVQEIKDQLDYREKNKEAVAAFCVTRTLGGRTKLLLDENAGKFMITSARDLKESNPDVLDFSQVTGCRIDVDESRSEIKKDGPDGKKISYTPPRYEYSYDFNAIVNVNHPYFDEMRFRINDSTIDVSGASSAGPYARQIDPRKNVDYLECERIGQEIVDALTKIRENVRQTVEKANAPKTNVVCRHCGATTTPDASGCCEYCGAPVE